MAFPSNTTLLEDFTGSDNTSPFNANWTNDVKAESGGIGLGILSNQGAKIDAGNTAFYSASSFGADQEAHVTVAAKPAQGNYVGIYMRLQSPGTSGVDGYGLYYTTASGTDQVELYRMTNASETFIAGVGQEFSAGDKLGFEAIGSTLKAYRFDGSVWTELLSHTDATYTSSGYIGLYADSNLIRLDDLRGGTVVTAAPAGTARRRRTLMGAGR